jgi:hypothetical protein
LAIFGVSGSPSHRRARAEKRCFILAMAGCVVEARIAFVPLAIEVLGRQPEPGCPRGPPAPPHHAFPARVGSGPFVLHACWIDDHAGTVPGRQGPSRLGSAGPRGQGRGRRLTVRQFEGRANEPRRSTLNVIRRAFEDAGVDFIDQNGGGPGVRLRDPVRLSRGP